MVTLKMRVKRISYIKVARDTANKPAYMVLAAVMWDVNGSPRLNDEKPCRTFQKTLAA